MVKDNSPEAKSRRVIKARCFAGGFSLLAFFTSCTAYADRNDITTEHSAYNLDKLDNGIYYTDGLAIECTGTAGNGEYAHDGRLIIDELTPEIAQVYAFQGEALSTIVRKYVAFEGEGLDIPRGVDAVAALNGMEDSSHLEYRQVITLPEVCTATQVSN